MISGKAGIKYGLQLNTKSTLPKQAKKAPAPLAPSIFDDDEVENIEAEIARQASKQRSKKEVSSGSLALSGKGSLNQQGH